MTWPVAAWKPGARRVSTGAMLAATATGTSAAARSVAAASSANAATTTSQPRRAFTQSNPSKKPVISAASACGCSIAAKWPPRGITLQRRMSVNTRAADSRGGRRISRGNSQ